MFGIINTFKHTSVFNPTTAYYVNESSNTICVRVNLNSFSLILFFMLEKSRDMYNGRKEN